GRAATDATHYVSVSENVLGYKEAGHRHAPEIDQELAALGATLGPVTFVPHLVPVDQGELITAYVRTTREAGQDELRALYDAAYAAAGLKRDGALDVGLLVSDNEATTSAARFTRSGVVAAPVQLCRERCDLGHLRAIAVNAGNANAATGVPGFESAAATQIAA